jgi:hypothetical protein
LGNPAKDQVPETAFAVRAHHNQVRFVFVGMFDKTGGNVFHFSAVHMRFHLYIGRKCACRDRMQVSARFARFGQVAIVVYLLWRILLDHMQEHDGCAQNRCK